MARWWVLALVSIGTFMGTLDVSIVTVAMPTLTSAFRTDLATSQWFVLAYSFVVTILLMPSGRLGDIIGRRRVYALGILGFIAGSVLCGVSVSALMLIITRGLQGAGSAMTMSTGPALVTDAFPSAERGKALGFIGTAVALGLLAGPLVGGVIVQYASWRWMFFINVPVGLGLIYLLLARVPGSDTRSDERLDVPGALLMSLAVTALLVGAEKRSPEPLIKLSLFANREFSIGAMTGWANYAAMIPVSVFLPFYLQNVLRYSPDRVGLILGFGPLTLAFTAPIAGTLSDRIGSRLLTSVGLLIAGVGLLSLRTLSTGSAAFDVIWRLALAAFGSALFVSPNSSAVMGSVRQEDLGVAGGTVALVRNLGMACGVALAGAIITGVQRGLLVTGEVADDPAIRGMMFLAGLKAAFLVSALICFVASLVSAMRVRPGDRETFERVA